MKNSEREALVRRLQGYANECGGGQLEADLLAAISALTQPEAMQEPVAQADAVATDFYGNPWISLLPGKTVERGAKLYTAPASGIRAGMLRDALTAIIGDTVLNNQSADYYRRLILIYRGWAQEAITRAAGQVNAEGREVALNMRHKDCHKAADAFWQYWRENGVQHKHGYYESTWGAINQALRYAGVVPHEYGKPRIEVSGTTYLGDCINATPASQSSQPDTVAVPREAVDKLVAWNSEYPPGRIVHGYDRAETMERELQEAIIPIVRAAQEAK